MRTTILGSFGVLALGLLAAPHPLALRPASLPEAHPSPPRKDASCKPSGPLAVELTAQAPRSDGSVDLTWSVRPVLPMSGLTWRVEASDDVLVLGGRLAGTARRERGEHTEGRLRVLVPSSLDRAAVTLVVTGTFLGSDEHGERFDERVEVRRAVTWGESAPVGPLVTQRDARSGASERVVLLPARTATPSELDEQARHLAQRRLATGRR